MEGDATQLGLDRKRKRTEVDEEQPAVTTPSPLPAWKRAKRPFQSQREARAAFWDSLSKVWLTRGALKEFNRRTAQIAQPAHPAPLDQCDFGGDVCSDRIKSFAKHGGPDLRDLRGYPEPTGANSSPHSIASYTIDPSEPLTGTTNSKYTSKTGASAYSHNFRQHLTDHGIYSNSRVQKPNNWGEIQDRIIRPRSSLSSSRFSDRALETFQRAADEFLFEESVSEDMVMRTVFPMIAGNADIPNEGNLRYTNLEPLTDGTLVDAKPAYYEGVRPEQIDKRVRDKLESVIMPSTLQHAPCLPSFFAERISLNGSPAISRLRVCYNGALGARGIHALRSFGRDIATTYDNNTYTISAYYDDGLLKMFAHHPTRPKAPGGAPGYRMTLLGDWILCGSSRQFREGAGAFRNARDWAKEQRDKLVAAANDRAADMPIETSTPKPSGCSMLSPLTNEHALPESETSADEPPQDAGTSANPSRKRLKRGPEKRHPKN